MSATISEAFFKKLCAQRGVSCRALPVGPTRTPDFEIRLCGRIAVAEVKQLDPNADDLLDLAEFVRIGHMESVPQRGRVRDMIGKGYKQLRDSAQRKIPGILVLYDNIHLLPNLDWFTIATAMFGNYGIALGLTNAGPWEPVASSFRSHRKLTRNSCSGISCVAVLERRTRQTLRLDVYHNPFAANPISPRAMALLADSQFVHDNPHGGGFVNMRPRQIYKNSGTSMLTAIRRCALRTHFK